MRPETLSQRTYRPAKRQNAISIEQRNSFGELPSRLHDRDIRPKKSNAVYCHAGPFSLIRDGLERLLPKLFVLVSPGRCVQFAGAIHDLHIRCFKGCQPFCVELLIRVNPTQYQRANFSFFVSDRTRSHTTREESGGQRDDAQSEQ